LNKFILLIGSILIVLFIYNSQKPAIHKINFDACNAPIIELALDGNNYSMKLDLGAKTSLSIYQEELDKLKKKNYGSTHWVDVKGNKYTTQRYLLPKVKLHNVSLYDVFIEEEPPCFSDNAKLWEDEEDALNAYKGVGRIGYLLLKRMHVILDFPNAQALFCEKSRGFSINPISLQAVAIPFELSSYGIVVLVKTDFGEKRFLIDTGSTITLLREKPENALFLQKNGLDVLTSSKFVIAGKDFGNKELFFFELSPQFNGIDGIIGMDFLKQHMLFLDFEKNILYLK